MDTVLRIVSVVRLAGRPHVTNIGELRSLIHQAPFKCGRGNSVGRCPVVKVIWPFSSL